MKREDLFKKWDKHKEHDYNIEDTLSNTLEGREIDVPFVFSGRNRGKSFEIAANLLADAYYNGRQFAYVRRNKSTNYQVEDYFGDKHEFISDMTDGKFNSILCKEGKMYLCNDHEENGQYKREPGICVGAFFSLSTQGSAKSLQYPMIYNMLVEEVMTDENYLQGEVNRLLNLYSSLKRHKKNFRMWLVSNTISQVCPYSNEWNIQFSRMKPDEIKLIKLYLGSYDETGEEEFIIIGAHYLKNKNDLTKEDLKKKRLRVKTGIASNKWDELHQYTTIDLKFMKQYDILDTVVFEWDDLMFQGNIVTVPTNILKLYTEETEDPSTEEMPIMYLRRKTTDPFDGTRLYTNNPERFGEYITRGFVMSYKIDLAVAKIYNNGWVIGADNLTMNDFARIFKNLQYLKTGL